MQNNVPRNRIRFCFPPMLEMGNMHSKLQLLKFEKYLRVVVPTGNLMSYDWGETGVMENVGRTPSADERRLTEFCRWCSSLTYPDSSPLSNAMSRRSPPLPRNCSTSCGCKRWMRSSLAA